MVCDEAGSWALRGWQKMVVVSGEGGKKCWFKGTAWTREWGSWLKISDAQKRKQDLCWCDKEAILVLEVWQRGSRAFGEATVSNSHRESCLKSICDSVLAQCRTLVRCSRLIWAESWSPVECSSRNNKIKLGTLAKILAQWSMNMIPVDWVAARGWLADGIRGWVNCSFWLDDPRRQELRGIAYTESAGSCVQSRGSSKIGQRRK